MKFMTYTLRLMYWCTRQKVENYFDLITFYISSIIQLKTFTTFYSGDSGEK